MNSEGSFGQFEANSFENPSTTFDEVINAPETLEVQEVERTEEQDKAVGETAELTVEKKEVIEKKKGNRALNDIRNKNLFEIFLGNEKLKRRLTGGGVVLLSALFLTGCGKDANVGKDTSANQASVPNNNNVPVINVSINDNGEEGTTEFTTTSGETYEVHGIQDGYNKPGLFVEAGLMKFADAGAAAEHLSQSVEGWEELTPEDQEKEIVKFVAKNQSESLADYYCQLPDDYRPDSLQGIKDEKSMENAIESLSDEDYDEALQNFNDKIDEAEVSKTKLNGTYYNAYMSWSYAGTGRIDPTVDGHVTHEDTVLVHTKTNESGYDATRFSWEEGTVTMDMKLGYNTDANGNIEWHGCAQAVNDIPDMYTTLYSAPGEESSGAEEITTAFGEGTDGSTNNEETIGSTDNEETIGSTDNEETIGSTDNEETIGSTDGSEGTEWGKTENTHAENPNIGHEVDVEDTSSKDSEVTKEQNDTKNTGNEGHIDDGGAAPGVGSENNGLNDDGFAKSGITAPEATTENTERLQGNEKQGGNEINGDNIYHSEEEIKEGEAIDNLANAAQTTDGLTTPGESNLSPEAVEDIVNGTENF